MQENISNEEVLEIINKKPSWITLWGTLVLVVVTLIIAVLVYFLKYPDQISGKIIITNEFEGNLLLSKKDANKLKMNQDVTIKIEGYPSYEYGFVQGIIEYVSGPVDSNNIKVKLPHGLTTNLNRKINYKSNLEGIAEVQLRKVSLLEKIFRRYKQN